MNLYFRELYWHPTMLWHNIFNLYFRELF